MTKTPAELAHACLRLAFENRGMLATWDMCHIPRDRARKALQRVVKTAPNGSRFELNPAGHAFIFVPHPSTPTLEVVRAIRAARKEAAPSRYMKPAPALRTKATKPLTKWEMPKPVFPTSPKGKK